LITTLLSGNRKRKEQQLVLTLMFVGVTAIAVLIPLISIIGLSTMNDKFSSQPSFGDMCKENALKYEQLGYYKGGAAPFNAVMATCAVGSS
jgi:hypothetical protein